MKKIFLTLFIPLIAFSFIPANADILPFQIYGGAQVGYASGKIDMETNSTTDSGAGVLNKKFDNSIKKSVSSIGLFLGARYFVQKIFFGAELEMLFDSFTIKKDIKPANVDGSWKFVLKRKSHIVGSLVLGAKLNRILTLYTKLGLGYSKFKFSEGLNDLSEATKYTTVMHFVPAIGIEYEMLTNLAVRLEVAGEIAGNDILLESKSDADNFEKTKAKYTAFSVKVGALFKF